MTEHLRPVPAHPSTDELADWHAGSLDDPTAAAEIASHVATCPACTAEVAALDDVARLLAEAGAEPVVMPADVAADLDAALARVSLERDYGVVSLEERRGAGARRIPPAVRWIGGAAAAVVIVGLGYQALGPGSPDSNSTSAGSAASEAGRTAPRANAQDSNKPVPGPASAGSTGSGTGAGASGQRATMFGLAMVPPKPVTRDDVGSYARELAGARSDVLYSRNTADSVVGGCTVPSPMKGHVYALVRWDRARAYLDVNRETREVTVYTCDSPAKQLYATTY